MLSVRRTRQHLSTFASLLVMVAIVSGLGVGLIGYLQNAATVGVRGALSTATGADAALRLGQSLADDGARQDRAIRDLITQSVQHAREGDPPHRVPERRGDLLLAELLRRRRRGAPRQRSEHPPPGRARHPGRRHLADRLHGGLDPGGCRQAARPGDRGLPAPGICGRHGRGDLAGDSIRSTRAG